MPIDVIKPSIEIIDDINGPELLKRIERAGRTCYKSEDKITDDSAEKFVRSIIARGHETVIEHEKVSVRVICDRGVTHEIVRHRLASYSQESTRYCDYKENMEFIDATDHISNPIAQGIWHEHMVNCELVYKALRDLNVAPQMARSVLPNSLKTEIVMTLNLRAWRHFFDLRTAKGAHPQMREIAFMILDEMKSKIPVIFDDIEGP